MNSDVVRWSNSKESQIENKDKKLMCILQAINERLERLEERVKGIPKTDRPIECERAREETPVMSEECTL